MVTIHKQNVENLAIFADVYMVRELELALIFLFTERWEKMPFRTVC